MHVRNFWIEAEVDGRASSLQGGPRRPDGGVRVNVFQRHAGEVRHALRVVGRAMPSGRLGLHVEGPSGETVLSVYSDRDAGNFRAHCPRATEAANALRVALEEYADADSAVGTLVHAARGALAALEPLVSPEALEVLEAERRAS